MRILAIETALIEGSVAALENSTLLHEIPLNPSLRTTRTLNPALQEVIQMVGWRPADVQSICVSQGPGSFTGLRIGVTAAKAFAYATKATLAGVNTLHVLAAQVPDNSIPIWAVMNAERGQVYASQFVAQNGILAETIPARIVDAAELFRTLATGTQITGPALRDFAEILPSDVAVVDEKFWRPRAATVGQLGFRKIESGQQDDVWSLLPFYLRESAAVEKAKE